MTWISVEDPRIAGRALAHALEEGLAGYPGEYTPARAGELRLPQAVAADSIVMAHSLIPKALQHVMAAYGALLDPQLPLARRDHELIAVTVSSLNRCFY